MQLINVEASKSVKSVVLLHHQMKGFALGCPYLIYHRKWKQALYKWLDNKFVKMNKVNKWMTYASYCSLIPLMFVGIYQKEYKAPSLFFVILFHMLTQWGLNKMMQTTFHIYDLSRIQCFLIQIIHMFCPKGSVDNRSALAGLQTFVKTLLESMTLDF